MNQNLIKIFKDNHKKGIANGKCHLRFLFHSFTTKAPETTTTTKAPEVTTKTLETTENVSQYPTWDSNTVYTNGNRVCYNGKVYQAKWWTVGENPETCGQWGVWKQV